jgi:glycosyltransferase involved in cell wall biosynthesis
MNKLYVVMPAYNEEGAIAKIVDEWHTVIESIGNGSKLVIFNDGSKDRTRSVLEKIKSKYPNLIVVHKENAGHGPTCILAYKYAVAEGADWIFQTDSDGQTKASGFLSFWKQRNNYDFIIGWRLMRGDGLSVKDANTPFRLMKVDRLRQYLPAIPDDYFLPNTLLSVMITKNKERIAWQKITFAQRTSGVTSIPLAKFGKLGIKLIAQLYRMRNIRLPK